MSDVAFPESSLDEITGIIPELSLRVTPGGDQKTLISLVTAENRAVITVVSPLSIWPVKVIQHHLHPGEETVWAMCGENHCPNRPRFSTREMLHRDNLEEAKQQESHTPIDSSEKLMMVCQEILSDGHAKNLLASARRYLQGGKNGLRGMWGKNGGNPDNDGTPAATPADHG